MKKIYFLSWLLSFSALSIPTYNTTSLVLPKGISLQGKKMQETARVLSSLQLFKDSSDENLYYYVPTFRVLPYEEGSGGYLLNHRIIESAEKALAAYYEAIDDSYKDSPWISTELKFLQDHIEKQTRNYQNIIDRLEEDKNIIKNDIAQMKARIKFLKDKHFEAQLSNNKELLIYIEQKINEEQANIFKEEQKIIPFQEKIDKEQLKILELQNTLKTRSIELISEYKINRLQASATHLKSIGVDVIDPSCNDYNKLNSSISSALEKADEVPVGLFSMTVYAGFTKAELEAITRYKHVAPDVKIVLMPGFNFNFGSNFDVGVKKSLLKESKMFAGSEGFGAYNGATVSFYLTLAGSKALKLSLDPFIVPLDISAETTFKLEPFKAKLKCDYRHGYKINGRTDIIDGAVIFDGDISNNIKIEDISDDKNGCSLEVSGDKNSAQYAALQTLKDKLQSGYLKKVDLTNAQKQKYYDQMLQDIKYQQNRANYDKNKVNFLESFIGLGWEQLAIQALVTLSDTFWHTRKEDVHNINNFNFMEEISSNERVTQRASFSARLCLKYNAHLQSYVRCNESEQVSANNMTDATQNAQNSTDCSPQDSIVECGHKRAQAKLNQPYRKDTYEVDNFLFPGFK